MMTISRRRISNERTNTNFETNPGEFDYLYGAYWRAANGKQVRFDEIYEKSLVVDIL